jgi:alpha-L-fucosidase
LPADFADIHNPGYGTHAVLEGAGDKSVIKNWVDSRVRVEWMFNATEPGIYKIEGLIKAKANCIINIGIGEQKIKSEIQPSGNNFEVISLGQIEIPETGNLILTISPEMENWNEIELMNIVLSK